MSTSPATTHPVVQARRELATALAEKSARLAVEVEAARTELARLEREQADAAWCASINNDRADYATSVLEGRNA